jgi:hypothetical protein
MFWIYDIPNWLFFLICNAFFIGFGQIIFLFTQKIIIPKLKILDNSNDLLNYFIAAMGAFYSITLGLIAVGTWEKFDDTSQLASDEASSVAALYRDVSYFPQDISDTLKAKLRDYTKYVIEEDWPLQQKGILPSVGTKRVNIFQKSLYTFEPKSSKEELLLAEALAQFNHFILLRRSRLASITDGLPSTLWLVIFTGAIIIIFSFSLFLDENISLQRILMAGVCLMIGTSIFLIAAMDYPYRGDFSVGPEAFQLIYKSLMTPDR